MTNKIDITKPLKLSDGTPCELHKSYCDCFDVKFEGGIRTFESDGKPRYDDAPTFNAAVRGRTLRNVKESEVRTGLEHLERLEQLARRIAENYSADVRAERDLAREIVAELDALNGPKTDEEWVRHIAADVGKQTGKNRERFVNGDCDSGFPVRVGKACIAKGRELALAELHLGSGRLR